MDKFCGNCGQRFNVENENQPVPAESKKEPVKTNAIITKLQGIAKKKEGGFFAKLVGERIGFI